MRCACIAMEAPFRAGILEICAEDPGKVKKTSMEARWVQFQPFFIRRTAARVESVHPQGLDQGSRKTIFAAKAAKKERMWGCERTKSSFAAPLQLYLKQTDERKKCILPLYPRESV